MNAKEARNLAGNINSDRIKYEVEKIDRNISGAASLGLYHYRHFDDLTDATLAHFTELGYTVKRCTCGPNESGVDFNW